MSTLVADYDFELPEELIAQNPAKERHESRMLVMDKSSGNCELRSFSTIINYLNDGDCLVINNTKVIPARLFGKRNPSGGQVEAFMLEEISLTRWNCMLRPGRRLRPGAVVDIDNASGKQFTVIKKHDNGTFEIEFNSDNIFEILDQVGEIPLPPYIQRTATDDDKKRYQTVYAENPGAVAAPTAGLHFTPEILDSIKKKGVKIVDVTLHVGAGTFKPVKVEDVANHEMHEEIYELSIESAKVINQTRTNGGRIFAVGTTSVRVLESCADSATRQVVPQCGKTKLFMYPPKKPIVTDALLTNFHLPKSTLLMLVSTFSSREKIFNAYQVAIKEKMRFYSYGDCMLILPLQS